MHQRPPTFPNSPTQSFSLVMYVLPCHVVLLSGEVVNRGVRISATDAVYKKHDMTWNYQLLSPAMPIVCIITR